MFQIQTEQIKEPIIKQAIVSHLKFPGYAGGILFLTAKRVLFRSNDKEFKNYQLNFPFDENFYCKSFSLLGFVKNAIRIQNGNKFEVFFLENKKEWLNEINKVKGEK